MFYEFVNELPLVAGNQSLNQGNRVQFSVGHVRKSKADSRGNRDLIFYDEGRDIGYRINRRGMLVEYGAESDYQRTFIPNREGGVHHINFAEGPEAEINAFILLVERMQEEHEHMGSVMYRIKMFFSDPVGKVFILAAGLYTVATIFLFIYS